MKSLVEYIYEKYGVSEDINILTEYIFNVLKDNVYRDNPENPKISWLYQQYKDYGKDVYPIEINFDDVSGFNQDKYNLLTYRDMGEDYEDYECDMLINITNTGGFGCMDTSEPLLSINAKFMKSKNIFDKNQSGILNTISHELTHYVQHMCRKGDHHIKFNNGSLPKEFINATEGNMKYYLCNFLLYIINPIEMDARKMGFYQTIKIEFDKRLKEWQKQNKGKQFDEDDFIHFCMYHKDYHNNVLHMEYLDLIKESIEKDTWENYKKCFDNQENKYGDASIIYVLLNICDNRTNKPYLPMPSKINYVMNINSEQRFNEYKTKLLKHYNKNTDKYKKKIKNVIKLIIEEKKLLNH